MDISPDTTFTAYRVDLTDSGVTRGVTEVGLDVLPDYPVTVEVHYSSLNYKDALSASGNRGVSKNYPHTPGIDAAGVVVDSSAPDVAVGTEVIVTSYDLGMNTPGGFGRLIRVPSEWVVPKPDGLSLREAMILGTAGFTAAMSLDALFVQGLMPNTGPVVVTGASGGVGSLAVAMLARLGFEVVAGTGSASAKTLLSELGASRFVSREALSEASKKPMLKPEWAGAVDTVGGTTLEHLIKTVQPRGSVAACGLVGGTDLSLTVFPFILRGVNLLGIDSATCPLEKRQTLWAQLAGPWKPDGLEKLATDIGLDELDDAVEKILAGETTGRVVVSLRD